MALYEALLNRPLENIPTVILLMMGILQLSKVIVNLFVSTNAANTSLQQGNQQIIAQDNSLQTKLIDEMTARRLSDEQLKARLMDLLDEKVTRIDLTTIATHSEAKEIRAEIAKMGRGLTIIYKILKKEGA